MHVNVKYLKLVIATEKLISEKLIYFSLNNCNLIHSILDKMSMLVTEPL